MDAINSRKPEDLDVATQTKYRAFMRACDAAGVKVLVTSTFRNKASQDGLYAQGRTIPGGKVTNALGGNSMHQYRCAFDFCPYAADGKTLDWGNAEAFAKVGAIGQSVGLEWGGAWTTFKDMPHLQNTQGVTIQAFKAKYPDLEAPLSVTQLPIL